MTLNLEEAAKILRISPSRLAEKASKRLVPAYKPFKSWLFFKEELENFIRGLEWHSTNKKVLISGSETNCLLG